ncbi:MAG: PQQ-binding-like beta-propeller repeat protein [Desulfobacterales bacterium]|nr:PQQ-binding-like beta-propeller repeat protein [Desulfobacterales bacterium]
MWQKKFKLREIFLVLLILMFTWGTIYAESPDCPENCSYESSCVLLSAGATSGSITAYLSSSDKNDYFQVNINNPGSLRVWTTGSVTKRFYLRTSGCSTIYDGGSYVSNFDLTMPITPGTYYVRVRRSSGSGDYTINASFTQAALTPISCYSSLNGNINSGGDADFYVFNAMAGSMMVETTGSTDTYGVLYNSNWTQNGSANNDGGSGSNFKITRTLTAGTYYLMVRHNAYFTGTGTYTLNLNCVTAHTINASASAGGTINPSGSVAVINGQDQSFDMTPNFGYLLNDVIVDGASVGALTTYDFTNVSSDHTIHAIFVQCQMETYYYDGDGDGYGDNSSTTQQCSGYFASGYTSVGGDCDDGNAAIHPGANDVCGNAVDEDCSGGDRSCGFQQVCEEISDLPLNTEIESAPPLIMFIFDDSGSMDWDISCPGETQGYCYGATSVTSYRTRWKNQWSGHNKMWYNPGVTYEPWPLYSNADPNSPKTDPRSSGTQSMDSNWITSSPYTLAGVQVKYSHYYVWSNNDTPADTGDDTAYLINLTGGNINYYEVTGLGSNDTVTGLTLRYPPPGDVLVTRSYNAERQNYANWFSYYRKRQFAAKAAVAQVINGISGVKIGIHTINSSVKEAVRPIDCDGLDDTDYMLGRVYAVAASGGTPLRIALKTAGQYLDATDGVEPSGLGASPYASEADGGACQQAYAILMTDGYWNGGNPYIGGDLDGDGYQNSLSDVAKYYYDRDLSTNANLLPKNSIDSNQKQHMVTYGVAFGLNGSLNRSNYPNCPTKCYDYCDTADDCQSCGAPKCPATWPQPVANTSTTLDDMWHATVNGRGTFYSAENPQQLVDSLMKLMQDIEKRKSTGASVGMQTQDHYLGSYMYQGIYDTDGWSGDLKAYSINADGTINQNYVWSASNRLDVTNWDTGRKIITYNPATSAGVPFRIANLSQPQKDALSTDPVEAQKVLNYIRGDASNEEPTGTLRKRIHKLGDIVNSAPIYSGGVVYVGANDGMLHAFDSSTGNELFAYIPNMVFDYIRNLSDAVFTHLYFVNATSYLRTIPSTTQKYLVSGLGKGGKGFFCLDISSVAYGSESAAAAALVKWEFSSTNDSDVGFSYSRPAIVKSNYNNGEYVVCFGNGYDSTNGKAVLFIIDLNGNLVKKIDTGYGNTTSLCNGLSSPAFVDVDKNGTSDYAYAGDLQGNLWKFDLSTLSVSSWDVAFKESSVNKPLFQARNAGGQIQPITSKPDIMQHCEPSRQGYIIVFGTGKYLGQSDVVGTDVQTVYGIWDWSWEWQSVGKTPLNKYFGSLETNTSSPPSGCPSTPSQVRMLSHRLSTVVPGSRDVYLVQQTVVDQFRSNNAEWRIISNNEANWFSASTGVGCHAGWYLDLPESGERVFADIIIRDGAAIVVSVTPNASGSPCQASNGTSWVHQIEACSGSRFEYAVFDYNGDGVIDKTGTTDMVNMGTTQNPIYVPPSAKRVDEIIYTPAIISDDDSGTERMYFNSSVDPPLKMPEKRGVMYWKINE